MCAKVTGLMSRSSFSRYTFVLYWNCCALQVRDKEECEGGRAR